MASPLDAIQKAVQAGFKGKLRTATVYIRTLASGVDDLGDATPGSDTVLTFDGIREMFTASTRAQLGIPQEDVSILLILKAGVARPGIGDRVDIEGASHQIRQVLDIDPAGATIRLQAFEVAGA